METLYDDLVAAVLSQVTLPAGADKAKCQADFDAMFPDVMALVNDVKSGAG